MFADALPDSIIKRLTLRCRELGAVNLGQGIPSFPTPRHILSIAAKALKDPTIGVYPNFLGEIELRDAIADRLNREHRLALSGTSHILVTVGAMEATASAILSLLSGGERVGIITPDYCNHFPQVTIGRGTTVEIPYIESENRWEFPLEQVKAEAEKGMSLLILTNPGNPTGAVASREELDALIALSVRHGFWLLVDETYSYLTYGVPFVSAFEYFARSDRLLVVRSFSKEFCMTGWRVGFVGGSAEAIHQISKVHDALVGCAAKISQRAARAALAGPQTIIGKQRIVFRRRRGMVMDAFQGAQAIRLTPPQGAYYAFFQYKGNESSVRVAEKVLTNAGVAVVPGAAFGKGGEGHLRLSFAVEDAVLADGLARILSYFGERKKTKGG